MIASHKRGAGTRQNIRPSVVARAAGAVLSSETAAEITELIEPGDLQDTWDD